MATVSSLDSHLGYWLRFVSNHVSHGFAQKLTAKDVTAAEWVVMRMLYGRPPTPPSHLANDIGMTRGAISKLAERLITKMLVVRAADPTDGRAQTLALTEKGKKLVPQLARLADANDDSFFGSLSASERTTLERLLKKLIAANGLSSLPID